jgi:hypothetical protein
MTGFYVSLCLTSHNYCCFHVGSESESTLIIVCVHECILSDVSACDSFLRVLPNNIFSLPASIVHQQWRKCLYEILYTLTQIHTHTHTRERESRGFEPKRFALRLNLRAVKCLRGKNERVRAQKVNIIDRFKHTINVNGWLGRWIEVYSRYTVIVVWSSLTRSLPTLYKRVHVCAINKNWILMSCRHSLSLSLGRSKTVIVDIKMK